MRKADLTDAIAQLDQADRQILALQNDLNAYAQSNPFKITTKRRADGWTEIYGALPQGPRGMYGPAVTAIVHAQRSSLDYVAVALAEANGVANSRHTYFPVTETKDDLADTQALKKVRDLHVDDQRAIYDMKPFRGGNDVLFALHKMNIVQKHRRLGVFGTNATLNDFGNMPGVRMSMWGIVFYHAVFEDTSPKLICAAQFTGGLRIEMKLALQFRDYPVGDPVAEVVPALQTFGVACRDVVAAFT